MIESEQTSVEGLQDYIKMMRSIVEDHKESNNPKVSLLANTLETTLDIMTDIIHDPEMSKVKYRFGRVSVPATISDAMVSKIKKSSHGAMYLLSTQDIWSMYSMIIDDALENETKYKCRIGGIKRSGMLCGKFDIDHSDCKLTSPCKNQV